MVAVQAFHSAKYNGMPCPDFEDEDALDKLEGFTSLHGPAFYRLPVNDAEMVLSRSDSPVTFLTESRQAGASDRL